MKHLYSKIRKKVKINKTYEQGNIELKKTNNNEMVFQLFPRQK